VPVLLISGEADRLSRSRGTAAAAANPAWTPFPARRRPHAANWKTDLVVHRRHGLAGQTMINWK